MASETFLVLRSGMQKPREMTVTLNEQDVVVRYDYDGGEPQTWNGLTGVGSPGYGPCVEIYEVRFPGGNWETPDAFPQVDWQAVEAEVLERLIQDEMDAQAAYADYLYECERERRIFGED